MVAEPVGAAPVPLDVLADPRDTFAAYERWVGRTGHAEATKRSYIGEARAFVTWVCDQGKHRPDEVFTDPLTRDYAVRDYKRWMLGTRGRKPKGVDTALTGIDSMYRWVGLGPAKVKRVSGRVKYAPSALGEDSLRDVLRAAERRGPRDHALVTFTVGTGLRIGEMARLNVDDVWISARKGEVQVRLGKGDQPRTVPLGGQARGAVSAWLAVRATWPRSAVEPALFLSREGRRLAVRSIRHAISQAGKAAGVDVAPHDLRHTFATELLRNGTDPSTLADLLGHQTLDQVLTYTRPSAAAAAAAVEGLHVDY